MTCDATNDDGIPCEEERSHKDHFGMQKVGDDWERVYWPNLNYVGPVANAKEEMANVASRVEALSPVATGSDNSLEAWERYRGRASTKMAAVMYALAEAEGGWVSGDRLMEIGGSAALSRVRDMRKPEFGGFKVEGRPTSGTWDYRWVQG